MNQNKVKSEEHGRKIDLQGLLDQPGPINPNPDIHTPRGEEYRKLFEDLQGNIIKGHDRDYASHIFIKFTCDDPRKDAEERNRIRTLIKERISKSVLHVTSAARQFRETSLYREHRIRGKVFANFFLTYSGYTALELEKGADFEPTFKNKMAGSKDRLNDSIYHLLPDPSEWQGYKGPLNVEARPSVIDAMILIADDDEEYLKRTELRIIDSILIARPGDLFDSLDGEIDRDIPLAEVVTVQRGAQLRAKNRADRFNGHPIEHFGYLDGISNPLFLTTDQSRVDDFMLDAVWKPWAKLSLALLPDPHRNAGDYGTGSYLVFRKLEQDVAAFEFWKRELARALKVDVEPDPSNPEQKIDRIDRVGALIIGRYKEGTPTSQTPALLNENGEYDPIGHKYQLKITNDFTYAEPVDDSQGLNCPFHAHIRAANDRGVETRDNHRIVRRGITYGSRSDDLSDHPSTGVGLLFMCFQRSIRDQFEHIQRKANGMTPDNDDIVVKGQVDPIIGQINEDDLPKGQEWPNQIGRKGENTYFRFPKVVSLKGGEYFFAPSISFLRNMTGKRVLQDDPIARSFAEKGL